MKPIEVKILGMEKNEYFKREVADFFISELENYFEENKISDQEKILILDKLIEEFG